MNTSPAESEEADLTELRSPQVGCPGGVLHDYRLELRIHVAEVGTDSRLSRELEYAYVPASLGASSSIVGIPSLCSIEVLFPCLRLL